MTVLAGKRILVSRARAQAGDLGRRLAALGAQPIFLPTILMAPLADYAACDQAIQRLAEFHWLIFTSVNAVEFFWGRLAIAGVGGLPPLRVAAVGPATAAALAQRGVRPAYVPSEYVAEAIAAGLGDLSGQAVLLPAAEAAREALAQELAQRGARVAVVPVYRTLPAPPELAALAELRRGVDALTFTSASTVRNFVALAGPDLPAFTGAAAVVCLGPLTAQAARSLGLRVDRIAAAATLDALVAALVDYFTRPSQEAP